MAILQDPLSRNDRRTFPPVMRWLISGILLAIIFTKIKKTEQDSAKSIEKEAAAGEQQDSIGIPTSTTPTSIAQSDADQISQVPVRQLTTWETLDRWFKHGNKDGWF
jgi:hypothetical protein